MRLSLIGGFELRIRERPVTLSAGSQRLVAFLALRDRPIPREHVAGQLWADASDDRAMASLRSALWRLRRAGADLVVPYGEQLLLRPDVAVDVRALLALIRQVFDRTAPPDDRRLFDLARAGDLLPDWDAEWVLVERERLRQMWLHALEQECERLAEQGRFGRALEACLAAVAGEPFRESAQRALIKLYLAEGNVGDALTQYRTYRQLIRDELGLRPSSQMEDLVRDLMPH